MKRVDKPWGYELWWAVTDRYVGKILFVRAGQALSLQYHERKAESMYCLSGRARLTLGETTRLMAPGEAVDIPPGLVHRLEALEDVTVVEVSTPELDDVVRLEDRYGRQGTSAP
ncbi:MAG: phosphomannose isomerase type II C-terminal cupin domain [Actinomycetia bacterium]|nr:phosphomannose isomerase type II C-terminal cupin domain [Actinomycetes bacterium]